MKAERAECARALCEIRALLMVIGPPYDCQVYQALSRSREPRVWFPRYARKDHNDLCIPE